MFTDDVSDLPDGGLKNVLGPILSPNRTAAGMLSTTPGLHLTPEGLQDFTKHIIDRGIFSPNPSGATELPQNALLISPGMLNTKMMSQKFGVSEAESIDLINRKLLKTVLHETGHGISEKSGFGQKESIEIKQKINSLYKEAEQAKNDGQTSKLASLKDEIDTKTAQLMRANAMEESRAESFSYEMLPKTELGKKMLEETKSAEFKRGVEGSTISEETRRSTFTGTKYYNFREGFSSPFEGYHHTAGLEEGGKYQTIFGDDAVDEARITADVVGSGTILRSNRVWGIQRSF